MRIVVKICKRKGDNNLSLSKSLKIHAYLKPIESSLVSTQLEVNNGPWTFLSVNSFHPASFRYALNISIHHTIKIRMLSRFTRLTRFV